MQFGRDSLLVTSLLEIDMQEGVDRRGWEVRGEREIQDSKKREGGFVYVKGKKLSEQDFSFTEGYYFSHYRNSFSFWPVIFLLISVW